MKQEYSYGAVVYRIRNGKREFLVEHMALGHVSIPKGHIEEGETESECALREIMEETHLKVSLNTDFSHVISYSPKPGVNKTVTFYLAKALTEDIIPQKEEVSYTRWFSIDEAIKSVTFNSDKETLKDAFDYMEKHHIGA